MSIPVQRGTHAQVFVCLPCYNEADSLSHLLQKIHYSLTNLLHPDTLETQYCNIEKYQILAVDDGSTDNTRAILNDFARKHPLTVVSHKHNQGLTETYRTLFETLKERAENDDIAVFMDADNTHPPEVITDLVKVASTKADVVVASRYKNGVEVGVPFKRRLLSKVVNWLIRNLIGIAIRDCTCGFRAYRVQTLKELPPLESKGFEVSAEVLIRISMHKPSYNIEEIPLTLHYDRKKGSSKIHVSQTIKAYLKLLWKYSRIDLTPFIRRVTYKISRRLGKTYDRDPVFWNDGIIALAFLIVSFFIYDTITRTLPQTLRLLSYVGIAFISFCIQHFLRRFWIFQS
ncbi:MAG: glycosyltransferase family 2 protein [Candidatus Bathyarchaeota archaeon]|nr:MAG: glycosyltransferase family 2 protein [Candidatus Bathyarchaeota archaeon]